MTPIEMAKPEDLPPWRLVKPSGKEISPMTRQAAGMANILCTPTRAMRRCSGVAEMSRESLLAARRARARAARGGDAMRALSVDRNRSRRTMRRGLVAAGLVALRRVEVEAVFDGVGESCSTTRSPASSTRSRPRRATMTSWRSLGTASARKTPFHSSPRTARPRRRRGPCPATRCRRRAARPAERRCGSGCRGRGAKRRGCPAVGGRPSAGR
jgi:hypothetical protein